MCAEINVSVSDSASFTGTTTLENATLNLSSATGTGNFECYGVCNLSGTVGPNETVVLGTDDNTDDKCILCGWHKQCRHH